MSAPAAPVGADRMAPEPVAINPWINLSGCAALFGVTVRRLLRPSRLLALGALFLLPAVIVLLGRWQNADESPASFEFYLLLIFLPTAIVPFAALMFSSGLIQDEVEEQTLTFLLLRPMPRGLIYVVKLLAAIVVTALLAGIFTTINEVVIWGAQSPPSGSLPARIASIVALYALVLVAYSALFGLVGLIFRKSLPIGVVYIILFEGFLATIPFVFRKYTVAYYFRNLALSWFGEEPFLGRAMQETWAIEPATAVSAQECAITLVSAALVFTLVAAWVFTVRELRVKTPETT